MSNVIVTCQSTDGLTSDDDSYLAAGSQSTHAKQQIPSREATQSLLLASHLRLIVLGLVASAVANADKTASSFISDHTSEETYCLFVITHTHTQHTFHTYRHKRHPHTQRQHDVGVIDDHTNVALAADAQRSARQAG